MEEKYSMATNFRKIFLPNSKPNLQKTGSRSSLFSLQACAGGEAEPARSVQRPVPQQPQQPQLL